ncbi:hypothetical protein F383_13978 [Gossypium arboreum]|uniref:Uncharacterized protein n=1 Tax=Gossypium arboreum TaxID=29729 RepID=A0A0B0PVC1_GOSAR|nr:hypothetical protein F383_13978 [Gossypium arboreum]
MLTRSSHHQKRLFSTTSGAIWTGRNKALHDGIHQSMLEMVQFIKAYLSGWDKVNSRIPWQRIEEE